MAGSSGHPDSEQRGAIGIEIAGRAGDDGGIRQRSCFTGKTLPLRGCAEDAMFEAAMRALSQMFSPPFRRVLWKSIGLALILIVIIGIALNRVFSWLATSGATWAEASAGAHSVWRLLAWVLSIMATLGVITGAIFLMPAVTRFRRLVLRR